MCSEFELPLEKLLYVLGGSWIIDRLPLNPNPSHQACLVLKESQGVRTLVTIHKLQEGWFAATPRGLEPYDADKVYFYKPLRYDKHFTAPALEDK
jgi:hypothetical protein